jgi:hypothetical protein
VVAVAITLLQEHMPEELHHLPDKEIMVVKVMLV